MLEIRGLKVTYNRTVEAVRGVDLTVGDGEVVTLLGGNGAGKTSLLRALSGTLHHHKGALEGTITYQGRALHGTGPTAVVAAGVGQVPEGRRIFGSITVEENLRAGGFAAKDRAAKAKALTRAFELFPVLAERRSQPAGLLSGGEQQMLAIGRALMGSPTLLALDEPSLGLAPMMAQRIGVIIREINAQGTSVLLVEQNAAMALSLANTAYVMETGKVTLTGPAAELADSDEVRDRYLGHTGDVVVRRGAAGGLLTRWEGR